MQKTPSAHHRTTFQAISSQLRHISTIWKELVKQQYLLHMSTVHMVNVSPLTAEIDSWVWGIPANFNGFHVFASLLHRRRSTEVNQMARCLGVYWAGTLCMHFWGFLPPKRIMSGAKFALHACLRSPILASLLHPIWAVGISKTLRRGIFSRQGIHSVRQSTLGSRTV